MNTIRFLQMTNQEFINLARKFCQESFLALSKSRMELEKKDSDSRSGRFGKLDASEIYPRRINAKEMLIRQAGEFKFPFSEMVLQNCQESLRIQRIHSEAGTNREERRSQQRTSMMNRESLNRHKPQMTLKPTPGSTQRAERGTIPCSAETD